MKLLRYLEYYKYNYLLFLAITLLVVFMSCSTPPVEEEPAEVVEIDTVEAVQDTSLND